jgi:hypothetical protein
MSVFFLMHPTLLEKGKPRFKIEPHKLDANAGKQLSSAATDA